MQYKVGIIGKYGAGKVAYDGQTVKTKNLTMLLEGTGNVSITKVDTSYFKKNNIRLLLDSLWCILTCKHIFLMVSVNGMNFYLPFLYYLNKIMHRKIYHYIIGSELLEMVQENSGLVKYLNALDVNWFEYESGTSFLRSRGVQNVATLSNFKMLSPVEEAHPYNAEMGIYRFCTFSRVMEEKGITDAIEAIAKINADKGKIIAKMDIYGPIEAKYEDTLKKLLSENAECITYKGTIDSQQSVDTLKEYYALLFPTRWPGEGVPGTIIDTFAAGIPIIATDWNANKELIEHKKQGILYPNEEMHNLEEAILWAIGNDDKMATMRKQSRDSFTAYMPQTILNVILNRMKGNAE